jgi:hypothetical protein
MRPNEIAAMTTNANKVKNAAKRRADLRSFQNSNPQTLQGAMGALKKLNYVGGRRKRKTHRKRKTLRKTHRKHKQ